MSDSSKNIEIERKFLIDTSLWHISVQRKTAAQHIIMQGYLCSLPESTVRIRLRNEEAFLTIKGKTNGLSRSEYEYAIPPHDAKEMLQSMCSTTIEKVRFVFTYEGFIWELDEFSGTQAPLILAEVELPNEEITPPLPPFVKEEVSHDLRYTNSRLSQHPYSQW